jgi:hypothetical protein
MESYAKVIDKTVHGTVIHIFSPLNRADVLIMLSQLCSMIEIEVEMDSDVIAAEAASSAVSSFCILLIHTIKWVKYNHFLFNPDQCFSGENIRADTTTNGD